MLGEAGDAGRRGQRAGGDVLLAGEARLADALDEVVAAEPSRMATDSKEREAPSELNASPWTVAAVP